MFKKILSIIVWTFDHILNGNRFLDECGEKWYLFWISLPEGVIYYSPYGNCLLCPKED